MERISFNQLIQEAIKDTEIWNYYQIPKDKYYDLGNEVKIVKNSIVILEKKWYY